MRMRGKKPIFNYKDCWNLDNTLSPIIHAGLVKFKEELVKHPFAGYPHDFYDEENDPEGEKGFQQWLDTLDKMIYAFDKSKEPDMSDYDFTFNMETKELPTGNSELVSIGPTNEQEYTRYTADMKIWEEKCDEGRELFSKFYHSLWI